LQSKVLISHKKNIRLDFLNVPDLLDEYSLLKIISAPFSFQEKLFIENNDLDYPYIPGTEAIGLIEKIGEKSRFLSYGMEGLKKGDLIYIEPSIICGNVQCKTCLQGAYSTCEDGMTYGRNDINIYPYLLGTLSEYMVILPGSKVHRISSEIPIYNLNLIGLISKAIRSISKKGNGIIGDNLIILGLDLFSLCCAIIANYIGMNRITILDDYFNSSGKKILGELNINFTEKLPEEKFDLIIDNKGNHELLKQAINLAKPEAKILVPFNFATNDITFSRNIIIEKELSFIGVSRPSWDVEQAIKFISNNESLLKKIPYKEYNLDDFLIINKNIKEIKLLNVSIRP